MTVPDPPITLRPGVAGRLTHGVRRRLAGRTAVQAALGNSAWLLGDRFLRMGFGLVVGVWIARYLGPDQFGLLSFAMAFTGLFSALASLGLDGIVVRELVTRPDERNVLLGTAAILKLVAGGLAMIVTIAAIAVLRPHDARSLWVVGIAAGAFIFQASSVVDLYFQSELRSRYTVIAAGVAFGISTIARILLLVTQRSVIAFAWATLGETALAAIFLLIAYRWTGARARAWEFSARVARLLLKDSWPLILSSISITIAMRIDQIMIGQMLSDREVGLYAAAARMSEVGYFIPSIIVTSIFPTIITTRRQSEALFYVRLQKLMNVLVGLGLAMALPVTLLAPLLMRMLFGAQYAEAANALRIMVWAGCFVFFGSGWSSWMLLENRTKTMLLFQLNAAAVNIALNLVLIPRLGIDGAAYATLLSYAVGHTVLAAIIPSQRRALRMLVRAAIPLYWFSRDGQT